MHVFVLKWDLKQTVPHTSCDEISIYPISTSADTRSESKRLRTDSLKCVQRCTQQATSAQMLWKGLFLTHGMKTHIHNVVWSWLLSGKFCQLYKLSSKAAWQRKHKHTQRHLSSTPRQWIQRFLLHSGEKKRGSNIKYSFWGHKKL